MISVSADFVVRIFTPVSGKIDAASLDRGDTEGVSLLRFSKFQVVQIFDDSAKCGLKLLQTHSGDDGALFVKSEHGDQSEQKSAECQCDKCSQHGHHIDSRAERGC